MEKAKLHPSAYDKQGGSENYFSDKRTLSKARGRGHIELTGGGGDCQ